MASEKKSINKRKFRKGTYSTTLSVVVIAIVVVMNLIVNQIPLKYTEFDISTGKLYTIGDSTKEVLKHLEEEITIYYIVQTGNEDSNVQKLLKQYEQNSGNIKVVQKDPVANPTFVSQYTDDSLYENSLIVESNQRSKVIAYNSMYETELNYSTYQSETTGFDGEGQITSAINYVTTQDLPVVYYVEGHNEISIPESLSSRIQKANIDLQSLSLLTAERIPEDAECLLLNSPETDYSTEETKKVLDYLEKGGKAIILSDYVGNDLENYISILDVYGIEVVNGIVVETDSGKYVQQPYYIVPDISYSDITTSMTGGFTNVLLSGCQGYRVKEDVDEALTITTLLSPSAEAYVKTDPQNMSTYEYAEEDEKGPFIVAAAISKNVTVTDSVEESVTADNISEMTQIVCIASSSVTDDSINSMVSDGNYTFYMNSLSWLVDSEESSTVSIAVKPISVNYLTVTTADAAVIGLLLCILLPVSCLVVGGVVCYKRKKR